MGFVSRLPHGLIKAFRSTLDEVRYADLLLNVVDASDERFREQMRVTEETLRELGAEKIPCIHVMNKADKIMDPGELPKIDGNRIYLSAKQGYGIPALLSMIEEKLYAGNREGVFLIPYSRGELVSYLNENASVHTCEYLPEGVKIAASCRERDYERLREFCC